MGVRAEMLEQETAALAAATLAAAREMAAHATALHDAGEHLFLWAGEASRLRQRLAPLAEARAKELQRIAVDATALARAQQTSASSEIVAALAANRRAAVADTESRGDLTPVAPLGAKSDVGEAVGADATATRFSAEELAWGKKEAKARLSPSDFKAWKQARRDQRAGTSEGEE